MKTKHLLFLLMAVFMPLFAHAQEEVTVGEIKYKLYSVGAYVSGTTTKNIVVADIASSITNGTNSYKVIGIEDDAFINCTGLLIASIPSTVTIIGERAFMYCGSLTAIIVPGSVTTIGASAFHGCGKLNSLTLNSGIQSIGVDAFNGCQKLKTVTLPKTVVAVGHRAFAGCTELNKITIPEGLLSLGDDVFSSCESLSAISLPKSLINMGRGILQGCKSMTSVVVNAENPVFDSRNGSNAILRTATNELISGCKTTKVPNTTNVICEYAFANIDGLTSVTTPNSVTEIGQYAFYLCTGLASVTMGDNVETIGQYAFYGCKNLPSITIPQKMDNVDWSVFSGCTSLGMVTLNSNDIVSVNRSSNSSLSTIFGAQVSKYIIGNSVTSIGSNAFNGCSGLTSVTIPNSVTSIGSNAFKGCSGLTSVTIPNSVTQIGNSFSNCTGLILVTIGNSVENIEAGAFAYSSNLQDVICYNTTPPSMYFNNYYNDSFPFYYSNLQLPIKRNLYVPTPEAYSEAKGWSGFSHIYSLDELPTGIETIDNENTSAKRSVDDAWYTLGGQRLQGEPTTKGIYVRAGRKVLVK